LVTTHCFVVIVDWRCCCCWRCWLLFPLLLVVIVVVIAQRLLLTLVVGRCPLLLCGFTLLIVVVALGTLYRYGLPTTFITWLDLRLPLRCRTLCWLVPCYVVTLPDCCVVVALLFTIAVNVVVTLLLVVGLFGYVAQLLFTVVRYVDYICCCYGFTFVDICVVADYVTWLPCVAGYLVVIYLVGCCWCWLYLRWLLYLITLLRVERCDCWLLFTLPVRLPVRCWLTLRGWLLRCYCWIYTLLLIACSCYVELLIWPDVDWRVDLLCCVCCLIVVCWFCCYSWPFTVLHVVTFVVAEVVTLTLLLPIVVLCCCCWCAYVGCCYVVVDTLLITLFDTVLIVGLPVVVDCYIVVVVVTLLLLPDVVLLLLLPIAFTVGCYRRCVCIVTRCYVVCRCSRLLLDCYVVDFGFLLRLRYVYLLLRYVAFGRLPHVVVVCYVAIVDCCYIPVVVTLRWTLRCCWICPLYCYVVVVDCYVILIVTLILPFAFGRLLLPFTYVCYVILRLRYVVVVVGCYLLRCHTHCCCCCTLLVVWFCYGCVVGYARLVVGRCYVTCLDVVITVYVVTFVDYRIACVSVVVRVPHLFAVQFTVDLRYLLVVTFTRCVVAVYTRGLRLDTLLFTFTVVRLRWLYDVVVALRCYVRYGFPLLLIVRYLRLFLDYAAMLLLLPRCTFYRLRCCFAFIYNICSIYVCLTATLLLIVGCSFSCCCYGCCCWFVYVDVCRTDVTLRCCCFDVVVPFVLLHYGYLVVCLLLRFVAVGYGYVPVYLCLRWLNTTWRVVYYVVCCYTLLLRLRWYRITLPVVRCCWFDRCYGYPLICCCCTHLFVVVTIVPRLRCWTLLRYVVTDCCLTCGLRLLVVVVDCCLRRTIGLRCLRWLALLLRWLPVTVTRLPLRAYALFVVVTVVVAYVLRLLTTGVPGCYVVDVVVFRCCVRLLLDVVVTRCVYVTVVAVVVPLRFRCYGLRWRCHARCWRLRWFPLLLRCLPDTPRLLLLRYYSRLPHSVWFTLRHCWLLRLITFSTFTVDLCYTACSVTICGSRWLRLRCTYGYVPRCYVCCYGALLLLLHYGYTFRCWRLVTCCCCWVNVCYRLTLLLPHAHLTFWLVAVIHLRSLRCYVYVVRWLRVWRLRWALLRLRCYVWLLFTVCVCYVWCCYGCFVTFTLLLRCDYVWLFVGLLVPIWLLFTRLFVLLLLHLFVCTLLPYPLRCWLTIRGWLRLLLFTRCLTVVIGTRWLNVVTICCCRLLTFCCCCSRCPFVTCYGCCCCRLVGLRVVLFYVFVDVCLPCYRCLLLLIAIYAFTVIVVVVVCYRVVTTHVLLLLLLRLRWFIVVILCPLLTLLCRYVCLLLLICYGVFTVGLPIAFPIAFVVGVTLHLFTVVTVVVGIFTFCYVTLVTLAIVYVINTRWFTLIVIDVCCCCWFTLLRDVVTRTLLWTRWRCWTIHVVFAVTLLFTVVVDWRCCCYLLLRFVITPLPIIVFTLLLLVLLLLICCYCVVDCYGCLLLLLLLLLMQPVEHFVVVVVTLLTLVVDCWLFVAVYLRCFGPCYVVVGCPVVTTLLPLYVDSRLLRIRRLLTPYVTFSRCWLVDLRLLLCTRWRYVGWRFPRYALLLRLFDICCVYVRCCSRCLPFTCSRCVLFPLLLVADVYVVSVYVCCYRWHADLRLLVVVTHYVTDYVCCVVYVRVVYVTVTLLGCCDTRCCCWTICVWTLRITLVYVVDSCCCVVVYYRCCLFVIYLIRCMCYDVVALLFRDITLLDYLYSYPFCYCCFVARCLRIYGCLRWTRALPGCCCCCLRCCTGWGFGCYPLLGCVTLCRSLITGWLTLFGCLRCVPVAVTLRCCYVVAVDDIYPFICLRCWLVVLVWLITTGRIVPTGLFTFGYDYVYVARLRWHLRLFTVVPALRVRYDCLRFTCIYRFDLVVVCWLLGFVTLLLICVLPLFYVCCCYVDLLLLRCSRCYVVTGYRCYVYVTLLPLDVVVVDTRCCWLPVVAFTRYGYDFTVVTLTLNVVDYICWFTLLPRLTLHGWFDLPHLVTLLPLIDCLRCCSSCGCFALLGGWLLLRLFPGCVVDLLLRYVCCWLLLLLLLLLLRVAVLTLRWLLLVICCWLRWLVACCCYLLLLHLTLLVLLLLLPRCWFCWLRCCCCFVTLLLRCVRCCCTHCWLLIVVVGTLITCWFVVVRYWPHCGYIAGCCCSRCWRCCCTRLRTELRFGGLLPFDLRCSVVDVDLRPRLRHDYPTLRLYVVTTLTLLITLVPLGWLCCWRCCLRLLRIYVCRCCCYTAITVVVVVHGRTFGSLRIAIVAQLYVVTWWWRYFVGICCLHCFVDCCFFCFDIVAHCYCDVLVPVELRYVDSCYVVVVFVYVVVLIVTLLFFCCNDLLLWLLITPCDCSCCRFGVALYFIVVVVDLCCLLLVLYVDLLFTIYLVRCCCYCVTLFQLLFTLITERCGDFFFFVVVVRGVLLLITWRDVIVVTLTPLCAVITYVVVVGEPCWWLVVLPIALLLLLQTLYRLFDWRCWLQLLLLGFLMAGWLRCWFDWLLLLLLFCWFVIVVVTIVVIVVIVVDVVVCYDAVYLRRRPVLRYCLMTFDLLRIVNVMMPDTRFFAPLRLLLLFGGHCCCCWLLIYVLRCWLTYVTLLWFVVVIVVVDTLLHRLTLLLFVVDCWFTLIVVTVDRCCLLWRYILVVVDWLLLIYDVVLTFITLLLVTGIDVTCCYCFDALLLLQLLNVALTTRRCWRCWWPHWYDLLYVCLYGCDCCVVVVVVDPLCCWFDWRCCC